MILTVDIPFEYFQVVYLITDVDQKPFMVIGVECCADGGVLIKLQNEKNTSLHYIGEISEEKVHSIS